MHLILHCCGIQSSVAIKMIHATESPNPSVQPQSPNRHTATVSHVKRTFSDVLIGALTLAHELHAQRWTRPS